MRIVVFRDLRRGGLLFLPMLLLLSMALAPLPPIRQTQEPPVPATPEPGGGDGTTPTPEAPEPDGIAQIIHRLLFPAETIAEALTDIFAEAAQNEAESL